jgi:hypothetical protein
MPSRRPNARATTTVVLVDTAPSLHEQVYVALAIIGLLLLIWVVHGLWKDDTPDPLAAFAVRAATSGEPCTDNCVRPIQMFPAGLAVATDAVAPSPREAPLSPIREEDDETETDLL